MLVYNVTVKVNTDIHEEWLEWMKKTHIPEVLATGYFSKCARQGNCEFLYVWNVPHVFTGANRAYTPIPCHGEYKFENMV